jgi:hypothetical protein
MEAIVNDPLPRHPLIPDSIWPVIEKALDKDRERRFSSAEEMREAIAQAGPVANDNELGRLVAVHFPERLREIRQWDVTERVDNVARGKTQLKNQAV